MTTTLLFHKFVKKTDVSDLQNLHSLPENNPFLINRKDIYLCGLSTLIHNYKIKILLEEEYFRKFICIRTDKYPLMWVFWDLLIKLEVFNIYLQGLVYFFLKNQICGGIDFVPPMERVGNWKQMIKHFIRYKKCIQRK